MKRQVAGLLTAAMLLSLVGCSKESEETKKNLALGAVSVAASAVSGTEDIDFDKLTEEQRNDIEFVNKGFKNDCTRVALSRECVKKFGTGYLSFMRPQYEGPEEENGTDKLYFDNKDMIFKLREE